MKKALIISGGEYSPLQSIAAKGYSYVIACDKGVEYAHKDGIKPDIILGDMDSCKGDAAEFFEGVSVLTFPKKKDDTDTLLAIKHAIAKGYDAIHIACGLGGRLDHMLANIQSLMYGSKQGCLMSMSSDKEELVIVDEIHNRIVLEARAGYSLSLLALSDEVAGVSIEGTAYDVDNYILTSCYPLGVSNKWKKQQATISIDRGTLLIINSSYN